MILIELDNKLKYLCPKRLFEVMLNGGCSHELHLKFEFLPVV
jgi:hypothetical protein